MNSDFEASAEEIQFDEYFKKSNQGEDDDFEDSQNYSIHEQSIGKTQEQQNKQSTITGKASTTKNKVEVTESEDNYDDFDDDNEEESKELKIGQVSKQKTNYNDKFEDSNDFEDDDGGFDNAFAYNKDEFKSEMSESMDDPQQPDKNQFSVHMEKSQQNNPFKEKALVQTAQINKPVVQNQQIGRQETQKKVKEIEIQMKSQTSDVGFDDDIEDDHFSEEPIEDDVESNMSTKLKQVQNNDNGSTVNMASVIPNPKLVNFTKTNVQSIVPPSQPQRGNPDLVKTIVHEMAESQEIQDDDDFVQLEDSMHELKKQIDQIPSRFSPRNDDSKNLTKKTATIQSGSSKQGTVQSKRSASKQQSKPIRPQTAKQTLPPVSKRGQSIKKQSNRPAYNNNDLNSVLPEEEIKESDLQIQTKNLLQQKQNKQTRVVMRPESAKPKVGYDGKTLVINQGKSQPAIQNELLASIAKSKKFEVIKKLKEEQEKKKQMIVRNLKKANVIQDKQKETKKNQAEKKANDSLLQDEFFNEPVQKPQQNIQPADDDFFQEELVGGGDQAARPDDIPQDDGDDFNELEASIEQRRPSVRDLAQQKQQQPSSQQPKTTSGWNAATQPEAQQRQGPTISLLGGILAKKVAKQTPQGAVAALNKLGDQKNTSQQIGLQKDEKFEEILRQKKEKAVNKDVLGFMMEKNARNEKEKQEALQSNINKLAKDFNIGDKPKALQGAQDSKGSDKVPEHAKLVVDDEKLAKELADLKKRLKEINLENIKVSSNIQLVEKKKREKEAMIDKLMQDKGLMNINGSLQMQNKDSMGQTKNSAFNGINMNDIPNFDALEKEKVNPLDPVVKKIEKKGLTLEQCFVLFDDDGDEVLSLQEIKQGLKIQGIELLDSEMQELVRQIDENADGAVTLEEWINTLCPKFDTEKEFRQIMQNVDIDDPLVLEERILDLRFRGQRLDKELEILRETSGNEQGFNHKDRMKRHAKNPVQRKMADKINVLQNRLQDKMGVMMLERTILEQKIKSNLMAKDEVHQDFYETQRQKERLDSEYSMRLQSIQDNLNVLDHKLHEVTQLCLMLKTEREQVKTGISRMQIKVASMAEIEAKLDKQLEEILGKAVDGKDLDMLYELDLATLRQLNSGSNAKFDGFVKHFPLVRDYLKGKKVRAAIFIQRMFRRYRSRKQHLETLKKKTEMKRLLEEEEDRFYKSQKELDEAARVIARYWKNFKAKKMTNLGMIASSAHRSAFNKTIEVVYLPSIRKCFICKQKTALRQCPSCQNALYCEDCYTDYHARGHRKLHNYKRIRYGNKPVNEKEIEEEMARFSRKENQQPNILNSNISQEPKKELSQANSNQNLNVSNQQANKNTFQKEEVKQTPQTDQQKQNSKQPSQQVSLPETTTQKKSVKLSDEAFLRSIKQLNVDFSAELQFFLDIEEGNSLVRLSEFQQTLQQNQQIFKVNPDDLEKLCQIACDKCQSINPNSEDSIITWIDIQKLQQLIRA